jgi:glycogen synthase
MTADFSWNPSIPKYEALYRSALQRSAGHC